MRNVLWFNQSASQTRNTPILIMLHARYQRYMEDMTPFLTWEDKEGQHNRTLLMVDELPPIIEDNALSLEVLNKIESELAQFKPSYQMKFWKEISTVLHEWNATMRNPYFQLSKTVHKYLGMYGLISKKELNEAGFTPEKLRNFAALLEEYLGKKSHFSSRLINVLKDTESAYYAVGQDFTLFFPRIKKIHGEGQPATFLFSGTASLSPELSQNPNITCLPDQNSERVRAGQQISREKGVLYGSGNILGYNRVNGTYVHQSRTSLCCPENFPTVCGWLGV